MRRAFLIGLVLVVAGGATGCIGTAVTQGVSTVTGATPRFFELRDIAGAIALDAYKSVEVQPFDTSLLMGALPANASQEVQALAIRRLTDSRMFESVGPTAGAGPALLIRGRFVDYDPGGTAARVVGFGANPFMSAQIEVLNADSGQVLGIAMVTGTVKSAVRTGTRELADGVAKAIEGLLKQHHSKVEKERR
jgi:hypothetical protein